MKRVCSSSSLRSQRGFALLMALWVAVLAVAILVVVQAYGNRQAGAGQEALAKVRAYWAARAGVEATLARLAWNTESPDLADAFRVMDDMVDVAEGDLGDATYVVSHAHLREEKDVLGPIDAHAMLNIGRTSGEQLLNIPLMTEDVIAGITDWMDDDDDVTVGGAEISQYLSNPRPYGPRNAMFRSLAEMELVNYAEQDLIRGEDWNMNFRLDPEENDRDFAWPGDNGDGVLDLGWAQYLTTASVDSWLSVEGEERLILTDASASEISSRIEVSAEQADVIAKHVESAQTLGDFIRTPLNELQDPETNQPINADVEPLTTDQLVKLLDETTLADIPAGAVPGKLNINTADEEVLELIMDSTAVSRVVAARDSRVGSGGWTSIVDVMEVDGFGRDVVANLYEIADIRSNVYIVPVVGRDKKSGIKVEMIATLDRSTLPVVIRELRVR
ncbi:MAG: general secretion pathway protein GspK [Phycisphaeraceae bacterium]|nr:general secretion pathway protein GspK [Phycisphaerales bacterium]MCB9861410.1 general secretion pathway protein GspK [Phycisphaeraceae bacterium]